MNNFPPPNFRPSDAEVVAGWAAEALRDGRYALGQALAKIAMAAQSHEDKIRAAGAVPVPMWGATRVEEPRHPATNGHLSVINGGGGPTGDGDRDLAIEAARIGDELAATAIMTRPATLEDAPVNVPTPPQSYRCKAPVIKDGVTDECHGVAYWSNDRNAYVHVDGSNDTHAPLI